DSEHDHEHQEQQRRHSACDARHRLEPAALRRLHDDGVRKRGGLLQQPRDRARDEFCHRWSRVQGKGQRPQLDADLPSRQPSRLMGALQYIVEGGRRLSGTIRPSGNKNAALPIIAASLLTEQPVTLENMPRIRDVEVLVELVKSVGVSVEWSKRNTLNIHAKT